MIEIGQACYTSTNSVFCALLTIFLSRQANYKIKKTKLLLTAHSIVYPCISIDTCICDSSTWYLKYE